MQVPGLQDPTQLKEILGKTAKMSFQLVDEQANPMATTAPIGDEILPMMSEDKNAPPQKIVVQRRVMVSGDRLTDASQGFGSRLASRWWISGWTAWARASSPMSPRNMSTTASPSCWTSR